MRLEDPDEEEMLRSRPRSIAQGELLTSDNWIPGRCAGPVATEERKSPLSAARQVRRFSFAEKSKLVSEALGSKGSRNLAKRSQIV